jgi:hypothetical protein
MNGAGPDSCADHNKGRAFSERRYLRHGESTFKYQVSKTGDPDPEKPAWMTARPALSPNMTRQPAGVLINI